MNVTKDGVLIGCTLGAILLWICFHEISALVSMVIGFAAGAIAYIVAEVRKQFLGGAP